MSSDSSRPAYTPDNDWLERRLTFLARIVAERIRLRLWTERKLHWWSVLMSTVFSALAAAGLVSATVVPMVSAQSSIPALIAAVISLVVITIFELFRAFGVEKEAARIQLALDELSKLHVRVGQGIREIKENPLKAVENLENAYRAAESLQVTFHDILHQSERTIYEAAVLRVFLGGAAQLEKELENEYKKIKAEFQAQVPPEGLRVVSQQKPKPKGTEA